MSMAFPNESAEYRAARDRLLEGRRSCGGRWTRSRPTGGRFPLEARCPRTTSSRGRRDQSACRSSSGRRDALMIYSFMFPRHRHDDRPGPTTGETARLTLADGPCPSRTALLD
jgi:predicted dithiol-disulfide oxidoreductase (DUF899 family)